MDSFPRMVECVFPFLSRSSSTLAPFLLSSSSARPDRLRSFFRCFFRTVSLSGAVWIDRKRSKNALQVMAKAGDDMKKKGVSLHFSPPLSLNQQLSSFFLWLWETDSLSRIVFLAGLPLHLPRRNPNQQCDSSPPSFQEGSFPPRHRRSGPYHPRRLRELPPSVQWEVEVGWRDSHDPK